MKVYQLRIKLNYENLQVWLDLQAYVSPGAMGNSKPRSSFFYKKNYTLINFNCEKYCFS